MLRSRFAMGAIDAGLALVKPSSTIRKRIFIMLSILEASPHHTGHFLPEPFKTYNLIKMVLRMIVTVFRTASGLLLLIRYGG